MIVSFVDYQSILADHTSTAEERIQACFKLMVNGSQDAIDCIISGLRNDPSPIVRHECAYTLGELNAEEGPKALVYAIENDNNPFVVHEASLALSNLGMGRKEISKLLNHGNQDVIDTAEISLRRQLMKSSNMGLTNSPEQVIMDLSEHPEHRIQAAFKLLEDNSEEAVDTLLAALEQELNPIVKHEIIFCLGEVASTRVIEPLFRHMLDDDNLFVKHEAALALGTLGDRSAESEIRKLLVHPHEDIVESAEIALERLLTKDVI